MLSRLITVCLVTGGGALSIKCGGRLPLQSWGADLFCGVGAPACPIGSYCHIDSDGFSNFAVCCPNILASFPLYTSSLPLSLPLLPPAPLPLASTPLYSDLPAPAAPLYSAASSALPVAPLYSPAPAALPAVPLYAAIVKPPTIPEPEICPETGKQKLSCPINSCLTSDCFGVPGASCMVDYCGNCGPKWYGPYNQVLTPEQCNWLPAWNARLQAFATVQNQAQPMSALNFGPIQPQSQFTQASFQSPLAVSSSAPASNFQSLWESPQFSAQFAASPQSISSPQFSQQLSSQPISSPEFSAQISQPLSSPEFSAQSSSQPQISAQISSQPISSPQLSAQFSSQPISSPQLSAQTETIVPLPNFQKNVAGTRCPAPPDCSLDFLKASNSTINKMAESAADKQEKIWQEQAQQTTCRYENPQMAPNGCLMGCGTLVCEGPVRFLEIAMGQNSAVATWVPPLSAALGQTYTAELSYDGINWRNLPLEQPWATFARFEVEENRPFQVRVTAAGYPSIVKKFEFSENATMPVASTQIIETEPNMEASMEAPEGSLEASISL